MIPIAIDDLKPEFEFIMSRSSGPGGQHVNKVNSKVTLRWNIAQSQALSPEHKEHLLQKLAARLTKERELIISAQESRSQSANKETVISRLDSLLRKAFAKPKPRKATKPSATAKAKRLDRKKRHAEKKQWRKKLE
jgi:ribosome-associated protein